MFCYKCGNEIPDDSEFCPKCGTRVTDDEAQDNYYDDISEKTEQSNEEKKQMYQKALDLCAEVAKYSFKNSLPKDELIRNYNFAVTKFTEAEEYFESASGYEDADWQAQGCRDSIENSKKRLCELEPRVYSRLYASNAAALKKTNHLTWIIPAVIAVIIVIIILSNSNSDRGGGYESSSPDWLLSQNKTVSPGKTYSNKKGHFTFDYPGTWNIDDEGDNYVKLIESDNEATMEVKTKYDNGKYYDAMKTFNKSVYETTISFSLSLIGFNSAKITDFSDVKIDGFDAKKIEYTAVYSLTAEKFRFIEYAYVSGSITYIINFNILEKNYYKYQSVFEDIVESYTVKK